MNRADLEALDAADALAGFRDLFTLPEGVIYLDGNSLGALPRATASQVAEVIAQEWGHGLIRSWNDAGWIDMAARVADKIARVIGAPPGTVAVGDSTSVNLFKLLAAALKLRPDRRVILSERANFPTDLYVAEGLAALLAQGHELRLVDAIPPAFDPDIAVVMLTHVNYRTGAMHDMQAVTRIMLMKPNGYMFSRKLMMWLPDLRASSARLAKCLPTIDTYTGFRPQAERLMG